MMKGAINHKTRPTDIRFEQDQPSGILLWLEPRATGREEVVLDNAPVRIKALRYELAKGAGAAGDLLDDKLTIACGDGAIRILELQRAGKPPMKADAFLNGTPLKPPLRVS